MAKLNPFQEALKKAGNDPNAIAAATKAFFGNIDESTIPAGATVTYRSPDGARVEYTDAEGYKHTLQRNLDATKANVGKVDESTDRPAVVQSNSVKSLMEQLTQNFQNSLNAPNQLAQLTDADLDNLNKITSNTLAQAQQQFQSAQGDLVAQLYGKGINNSTIATDAAAEAAKQQALVTGQINSDAATRQLTLQQFLTQLAQQDKQIDVNALLGLSGQSVQAQSASGQIDTQNKQLNQQNEQFLQQLQLARDQYEQQQKGGLTKILGALASSVLNFGQPGSGVANILFNQSKAGTSPASASGIDSTFSGDQYKALSQLPSLFGF